MHNSNDRTAAAVAAYIINLQQTASFLQRKLHETNFSARAWPQMVRALNEHAAITQDLARLPAPAMNRGEPASVSVMATSIPIPLTGNGSLNPQQLQNLIQQQLRGLDQPDR